MLACDDGSACTSGDVCSGGICAGVTINCNDNNACTDDSCDKSNGCANVNSALGTVCDDNNACTVGDLCQAGACKPGTLVWVDRIGGSVPSPNNGYGSGGYADGLLNKSLFNTPLGIAFEPKSNALFVADTFNNAIRKVTLAGVVSTFAGTTKAGSADGPGASATFNAPGGIAADLNGNLIVADTNNHLIRKVAVDGTVTTLAGMAGPGNVDAKFTLAKFMAPQAVAVSATGLIAVADSGNNSIRLLNMATSQVTTLVGNGSGFVDGGPGVAKFGTLTGLSFDSGGNLFVVDMTNQRIRKVTPNGTVQTIGGDGTAGNVDSLDPMTARFNNPSGIVMTPGGVAFVTDSYNGSIRKGSGNGISTFAGGGYGAGDGSATSISFSLPTGIAVDNSGFVYVADSYNHIIRRIRDTSSPCSIGGVCFVSGVANPSNNCQFCGGSGQNSWTTKAANGGCDDGNPCTQSDTCTLNANGNFTCGGANSPCNDANACTNDACDALSGKCSFVANAASCNDGNPCTTGDTCANQVCAAGAGNACDDGTVCTTDSCTVVNNAASCAHTNVSFGTSCVPAIGQVYGFCAVGKCTGVEQSTPVSIAGASNVRLTGITRGPDGNIEVSGVGGSVIGAGGISALWQVGNAASPPTTTQTLSTAAFEFWSLAYRLVTGGLKTFPSISDTAANIGGYMASNGWTTGNGPTVPASAVRMFRHAAEATDANSNEFYYVGGNSDGATGAPPSTLYRFGFSALTNTWSNSGAGYGEMGIMTGWTNVPNQCSALLVGASVVGLYAPDSTSLWVAANVPGAAPTGVVALWGSTNSMNSACAAIAPGGSVIAGSGNSWVVNMPTGTVATGVHVATPAVVAIGYSSNSLPAIYTAFSANGPPFLAEAPAPTPPAGMPAFTSGAYKPTAVLVRATDTWVAGTVVNSGCNYVFALHGTLAASNKAWAWDKLIVTNSTAVDCDANHLDHLSVTRIWSDPTDGSVYLVGSVAKDSAGGTAVAVGGTSQGQFGVIWRIK